MRRRLLVTAALSAAVLLTGCYRLKIGQINADPTHWTNKRVTVEGVVTNSFGALGTGGYQIDDGTGKIVVITNRGVPNKGARVEVNGNVQSGVSVMGKSWGTTIQERGHKVRW